MAALFYSPCMFEGRSDTQAIQAAVDAAVAQDIRVVVIPQKANGETWKLESAVMLPTDVTVILDGATVEASDTAFTNSNALKPETRSLGGEQESIYILGYRSARICTNSDKPQISLINVRKSRICGITFCGGTGIDLCFVRNTRVQKLKFQGCEYGLVLREGCKENIVEDICAETAKEAVLLLGGESPMYGRGPELSENTINRVASCGTGAPAVSIQPGPCEIYNLILLNISSQAQGVEAVRLGDPTGLPVYDVTVRGVSAPGLAVRTAGACNGLYVANAPGGTDTAAENVRVFIDDTQNERVELPHFSQEQETGPLLWASSPQFYGETDSETLQNAINAAAACGAWLVIPRINGRTGTAVWDVEKALNLPSNSKIALLHAHLRQADYTYENLLTADGATDITLLGVGNSILDGGIHNGIKARNAALYGMDIRSNATVLLRNTHRLHIDSLTLKSSRWYGICCEFCTDGRISDITFANPGLLPDLGGIQLHSGCCRFLVESITGVVNGELVMLKALENDGLCPGLDENIRNIHIRNLSVDMTRSFSVRLLCQDGRKIEHVLVEALQDVSVPENKRTPAGAVAVGSMLLSTKSLAVPTDLTAITLRDIYSRGYKIVELSGNSQNVQVCNLHGFGSCGTLFAVRTQADCRGLTARGLFFRCIQGSPYMRGTATSVITDPKKFLGSVFSLRTFKSTDAVLEHIRAEKIGDAFILNGGGKVTVRDWQIETIGRKTVICSEDSVLDLEDPSL